MSVLDDFINLTKDLTDEQILKKRDEYRKVYPELWKYWDVLIKERNAHNSKAAQSLRA